MARLDVAAKIVFMPMLFFQVRYTRRPKIGQFFTLSQFLACLRDVARLQMDGVMVSAPTPGYMHGTLSGRGGIY